MTTHYEIPAATKARVHAQLTAIRAAFPDLTAGEAKAVSDMRSCGSRDYYPYSVAKLQPAVEAAEIAGWSRIEAGER